MSRARPTRRLRAALAVLALGLGAGCVLGRLYREPLPPEAELFDATTADGWRLGIIRYRPERPRGLPVLLCHGVFNNGRILDIDAEHSLARWLASRGRDTYLLNLRGTRYSDQPDPQAGRSLRYSADTYVLQDMPAAIEAIRRRTGAPKVDLVGHSMGGHLAYIYVAERPEDVNAVVTLGASAHFHGVGKIERESGRSIARLGTSLGPTVPAPEIAHVFAPLHGEIEGPIERVGRNAQNVSVTTWKRFMATGVDYCSRDVIAQLDLWISQNHMSSADGKVDYTARLRTVRAPVLVIAAKLDKIAPVASVKAGYELLGGPKEFFIAGEENGFRFDYAHGDLVMADRAKLEVWPEVLRFFETHTPEGLEVAGGGQSAVAR